MEIHLLVCLSLVPFLIFGDITAEKRTLNSDVVPTNITNVDNDNILRGEYHNYWENATGPLEETKLKQEDKNINPPLVQRNSLVNHSVSINKTSDKERIENTKIYNSEDNKANTNRSKPTHSNTISSQEMIKQLNNITYGGEKEEKIQDTKNITKYPFFSISSRSKKIVGNHRIKIINKNQDYARDCFEDLRDEMGSQACYRVQCTDNGVKFFIVDEKDTNQKPVVKFEIGRGTRSNNDCITLPEDASSSKICIHWKDMKWSKKHFRGCLTANVLGISNLIRKPRKSCYILNCEEYKWGNKWIVPTAKPPLSALDMFFGDKKNKPNFSKPPKDLFSDFDPDAMEINIKVSSPDKPRVDKPVEEKNGGENHFNSRVFDYIETLPSANTLNPPPPSARHDKPINQKGNKPKPNKTPKPGNKRKEEKKQQPGNKNKQGDKSKTGEKSKQGPKPKPGKKHQQMNKPKPGSKSKPGNNHNSKNKQKPGNKSKPGKNSKQANKPKPTKNTKPVGTHERTGNLEPHGKSSGNKRNLNKPAQTKETNNTNKPGETKSASLTIKQTVEGIQPEKNKEVLVIQNGGINRFDDFSIVNPLEPDYQDTVLDTPEHFSFIPHNPDTQVVYILENSENYKHQVDI